MDAEKIMRTSVFGGFKKEDVISYVEELKKEIESLKADVEKKDGKIGELNSKVLELTDDCAQLEELKKETAEKSERISALENQNAEIVERLETLSKVSEEYSNAKSVIERNNREIEAAQARLGAAFLDARKYSENLVAAANEKAHAASKTISEDISKQASEIARLSSEVDKISAIFTKSVDELQANISILAQRMAATAKNLSIRQDAVFEPDLSLSFEVDDDASGVLETNDGSGLTYIQYPPHTDFHEDLNIKPDSFPFNTKEG